MAEYSQIMIDTWKRMLNDPTKKDFAQRMLDRSAAQQSGNYSGITVNPNQSVTVDRSYAPYAPTTPDQNFYNNITNISGKVNTPTMVNPLTGQSASYADIVSQLTGQKNQTTTPTTTAPTTTTPTGTGTGTGTNTGGNLGGNLGGGTGNTGGGYTGYTPGGTQTGGFQSTYDPIIQALLGRINGSQFNYDPNTDVGYQNAKTGLTRDIMNEMNRRGILNSTITSDRVSAGLSDLLPQYENMAYGRYQDNIDNLFNQINMYGQLYDRDYQEYKDRYAMEQDRIQNERQAIADAWYRVSQLGRVDNEASIVLGVPVGTLSREARVAKEQREQALADYQRELQDEYALEEYKYKLKVQEALAKQQIEGAGDMSSGMTEQENGAYAQIRRNLWENYPDPKARYDFVMSVSPTAYQKLIGEAGYQKLLDELQFEIKNYDQPEQPQVDPLTDREQVRKEAYYMIRDMGASRAANFIDQSRLSPEDKTYLKQLLGLSNSQDIRQTTIAAARSKIQQDGLSGDNLYNYLKELVDNKELSIEEADALMLEFE